MFKTPQSKTTACIKPNLLIPKGHHFPLALVLLIVDVEFVAFAK